MRSSSLFALRKAKKLKKQQKKKYQKKKLYNLFLFIPAWETGNKNCLSWFVRL